LHVLMTIPSVLIYTTPSDTIDYIPPNIETNIDTVSICKTDINYKDPFISLRSLDLDAGIPPNYRPISAVRLNINGTISAQYNGQCWPVPNAQIIAWQVDPTKLEPFSSDDISSNNTLTLLRKVSSAGTQLTSTNGAYSFTTFMPPSYGPPRHIVFMVSAPGFQTLSTRMYFSDDLRMQQLTHKDGMSTPGHIALDPRVANLTFVPNLNPGDSTSGFTSGLFTSVFNIVLRPLRAQSTADTAHTNTVMDINGLWSDQLGGLISVQTAGHSFVAVEVPHGRRWGTVTGWLDGDTVRAVDFRTSLSPTSLSSSATSWSHSLATGVIQPGDPFSTPVPGGPSMSIRWSGEGYSGLWARVPSVGSAGYRYLKLLITRETGGRPDGQMVINELVWYEGWLHQSERPDPRQKMRSPRSPAPLRTSCSSFQDQQHHCYRALDGAIDTAWVTQGGGSVDGMLVTPQWVVLDMGPGRGMLPTALRLFCDQQNLLTASGPQGCPKTFSVLGSHDNVRYEVLHRVDMDKYGLDYQVPGGKLFYFPALEGAGGRVDGQRCGSCDVGPLFTCAVQAWDALCASRYCTMEGLCGSIPACVAGKYLQRRFLGDQKPQHLCEQCPAGRYGNVTGLEDQGCSGKCAQGYYCPPGSVSEYALQCGGSAWYCPEGSALPIAAPAGRRTVGGRDGMDRDGTEECDPGHFCVGGVQTACAAGVYGDRSGLGSPACSGRCRAGHYCPVGSVRPVLCSSGHYCPDGQLQIPCPAGTFGTVPGLRDSACSGFCAPGHYCPQGSVSATQQACPAGRFGTHSGLGNSSCSGPCPPGHYCPPATSSLSPSPHNSRSARPCGGPAWFCPPGSPSPLSVSLGHYSTGGHDPLHRVSQQRCPPGSYCKAGLRIACPLGSYGNASGLFADWVNVTDMYLAERRRPPSAPPSSSPVSRMPSWRPSKPPVRAPSLSPSVPPSQEPTSSAPWLTSPAPYSPPTSWPSAGTYLQSSPTLQPTSVDMFLYDRTFECSGQCPPGHFCPSGSTTATPCPAGKYGISAGLGDANCSGDCPVGHYCPEGSVSPVPCPAGTFGSAVGMRDATCSGMCWAGGCNAASSACQEGHYCPLGSIAATQLTCGGIDRYCPAGSAAPIAVSSGYYTVGPDYSGGNPLTRTAQKLCEPGHYCVDGVQRPCPAGRFGMSAGLASPGCSGTCPEGYFCPEGSSNATSRPCPAGRYGSSAGLTDGSCSGLCAPGHYCPAGSSSPQQMPCAFLTPARAEDAGSGFRTYLTANDSTPTSIVYVNNMPMRVLSEPNSVFCPMGSILPIRPLPGYFTAGGGTTTRYKQIPCTLGSYCVNGVVHNCPPGRYGRTEGLWDPQCSGVCAKGHYCPSGSTSSTMYPCPAGKFGSTEGLTGSDCSGSCVHPLDCPPGSVRSTPILSS